MGKYEDFIESITPDILDPQSYVDWSWIEGELEKWKNETAALQDAVSSVDSKGTLCQVLLDHPESLEVIQMLLAHTDDDLWFPDGRHLDFVKDVTLLKRKDVRRAREITQMLDEMGLITQLRSLQSVADVSRGVLIGLEPNSRKNRRGHRFETLCRELIEKTVNQIQNESGKPVDVKQGIKVPARGEMKTIDFALYSEGKLRCVAEVNFYATSGSKPSETLSRAYPEIQQALQKNGIGFIVLTDGRGWQKMKNVVKVMLEKLDHCFTLKQATEGMLKLAMRKYLLA